MKYISKFKYDNIAHGYQVRLPEIKDGDYVRFLGESFFFKKSKYRTWKRCLEAAIEFRDNYLRKYKSLHLLKGHGFTDRGRFHNSQNKTGVIGVSLLSQIKESGTYYSYIAAWSEEVGGKRKQLKTYFSVAEYGKKGAFLAACQHRYDKKGTLRITDEKRLICKPYVPYL